MAESPVTFRRDPGSKAVGCLVYAAVTPFVALFLALFIAMPIMALLRSLGVDEERANYVFPALLPVMALGVAARGVREYRGRAMSEVAIGRDAVEVGVGSRRERLAFAEVGGIRLVPAGLDMACLLDREGGRPLRIPPDLAPFSLVQGPLERALIPALVQKLDERLRAGLDVSLREDRTRSSLRIARGLCQLPLAAVLILRPGGFRAASALFRHGLLLAHQGWRGAGGGFVVTARGLRHRSGDGRDVVPWADLESPRLDESGLVFRSRGGPTFAASPYATDYWPAAIWLTSRPGPPLRDERQTRS